MTLTTAGLVPPSVPSRRRLKMVLLKPKMKMSISRVTILGWRIINKVATRVIVWISMFPTNSNSVTTTVTDSKNKQIKQ